MEPAPGVERSDVAPGDEHRQHMFLEERILTESACRGDTDGDGMVGVKDLVNVISDWGTDGSGRGGDAERRGFVDASDLIAVLLAWGPCD